MRRILQKLDSNFQQYKRVWRLLKRPTATEFKTIAKVSIIGLLAIGFIGFAISLIIKLGFSSFF